MVELDSPPPLDLRRKHTISTAAAAKRSTSSTPTVAARPTTAAMPSKA
ncbi:MAG: hypothetical protein MZW92_41755 [Comamonadaceae bacterium]|nr:hypothetical protein [Comamonadaceae bacterium]